MKLLLASLFALFEVHLTVSVIITSNGLQRASPGDKVTFRWNVSQDERITSYDIYDRSNSPMQNGYNSYSRITEQQVILVLIDVSSKDAGNYSLHVRKGSTTTIESTACLFVYGQLQGTVRPTFGSDEVTEGDTLEFTCNLTSTSAEAAYRPTIQYTWRVTQHGPFENVSNGPAMLSSGDFVPGYTFKNNGRTLVISSIRYPNDRVVSCFGVEEGSNLAWNVHNSDFYKQYNRLFDDFDDDECHSNVAACFTRFVLSRRFTNLALTIRHRPYIINSSPSTKRLNIAPGQNETVTLSFDIDSYPRTLSNTNWTLTNRTRNSQQLPPHSVASSNDGQSIQFNLTSEEQYGNYSITLTNAVGSTTVTFQVNPPGRPETPTNLWTVYASHSAIAVRCKIKWSNSVLNRQTIYWLLRHSESEADVWLDSTSHGSKDYETINIHSFERNIQPDTNYRVRVWSVNNLGSSGVDQLMVSTRKQPKLIVSRETISIKGEEMIVNFEVRLEDHDMDRVSRVEAQCCSELSGKCSSNSTKYRSTSNQIVVNGIPDGKVYYIDLTIYSGSVGYYSDGVKGIRVSRDENEDLTKVSHQNPVVPLSIFLTITLISLIAILIAFLVNRFKRNIQSHESPQLPLESSLKAAARKQGKVDEQKSDADDAYEAVDLDRINDPHYYQSVKTLETKHDRR